MVFDSPYDTPDRRYKKRESYGEDICNKEPECYFGVIQYDSDRTTPPDESVFPSVKTQKDDILPKLQEKESLGEKEVWCLIEQRWFDNWKIHVNIEDPDSEEPGGSPPGPINNEALLEDPEEFKRNVADGISPFPLIKLKRSLVEKVDYVMVPDEVWSLLVGWYGGLHQGMAPTIARTTYSQNPHAAIPQYGLDLYPLFIGCSVFDKRKHIFTECRFPKALTFEKVLDVLRYEFRIKRGDKARLWIGFLGSPWKLIEGKELKTSLDDFGLDILESHQFILEKKSIGESFPLENYVPEESNRRNRRDYGTDSGGLRSFQSFQRDVYSSGKSTSTSSSYGTSHRRTRSYGSSSYDYYSNYGEGGSSVPGVCGLRNLGNTCFMNSGLQCLTKTRCFREYFTTGDYKRDINRDNVLGMNGEVASSFGDLMTLMWSGENSVVSPRHFKSTIGKFNHTFAGYHQQDSHELVAFLLDGIHEDLNRVIEKPQTYVVEGKGRENLVVSREAWDQHKKRNDSIIVEKFQGQLRSELECPDCKNVSVTFDPYMYLSVPVPGKKFKKINIHMVFLGNRRPMMKFSLQMPMSEGLSIKDVRAKLSHMTGDVPPERIFLCEIFSGSIYSIYLDENPLSKIGAHDKVFAFEIGIEHNFTTPKVRTLLPFCEARVKIRPQTDDPFEDEENNENEEDEEDDKKGKKKKKKYGSSYNSGYSYFPSGGSSYNSNRYNRYRSSSYCEQVINFPMLVNGKNFVTNGKEIYEQLFEVVKSFLKPNAREIILEKSNGRIDLDKPETLFPMPSEELRNHIHLSNQLMKKEFEKKKKGKRQKGKLEEEEDDDDDADDDDTDRIPSLDESEKHTARVSAPAVPPRPSTGPMSIPAHLATSSGGGGRGEIPAKFSDGENSWMDDNDDDERFSSADEQKEKMLDEDEDDDDIYREDLVDRGEYPPTTGGSITSQTILPPPDTAMVGEPEEEGKKKMRDEDDEDEDEEDWESPTVNLNNFGDRIMKGASREKENADLPNVGVSDQRDLEEEREEKELEKEKRKKLKKKKHKMKDEEEEEEELGETGDCPTEENFDDPKVWKKYLFTVQMFAMAVKTNENDPSKYEDNLYYDEFDTMGIQLPRKMRSYYTYREEKNFHTRVKVKLSDLLLKDCMDVKKLEHVENHESVEESSSKKRGKESLTLERCIEKFCEREKLTKDNKWYCRSCKSHVQALKKFDIWKLPEVLVVQIKRFSSAGGYGGYRSKIDRYIHYPFELDMDEFTINKENEFKRYRLYAVSNHFGGLGGGHYTAYAKAPTQSIEEGPEGYSWYNFDDSHTSKMGDGGAQASSGYILFYEAVNARPYVSKLMRDEEDEEEGKKKKKKKNKLLDEDEEEVDEKTPLPPAPGSSGGGEEEAMHGSFDGRRMDIGLEDSRVGEVDPLLGEKVEEYDSGEPQETEPEDEVIDRSMEIDHRGNDNTESNI